MTQPPIDPDLLAMAEDELRQALRLAWRDLSKIAPWGDRFDGISPGGRDVEVERSYLWAGDVGGDILCEVVVSGGPSRYEHGAKVSAVIAGPPIR